MQDSGTPAPRRKISGILPSERDFVVDLLDDNHSGRRVRVPQRTWYADNSVGPVVKAAKNCGTQGSTNATATLVEGERRPYSRSLSCFQ
jgi:hypothetical protein